MLHAAKEVDIYGVFLPPILLAGVVALIGLKIAQRLLQRKGFYRSDLERQVVDTSLFIILLGIFTFVIN